MLPMLRPPVFLVLGIFCGLCCGGGKFGGVPPVVAEEVAVARGEFVADDVVVVEADAPKAERVSTGGSAIPQEAAIAELIDAQETFKPLAVTPPTGGSASVRGSSGAGSSISCCGGADVIAHHADVLKLDSPFKEAWVQRTVARSHRHDDAGEAWPVQVVMNPHGYRFELFTVRNASHLAKADRAPSLDATWFPGFGWTPVVCARCGTFVGWHFTKLEPAETRIEQDEFYGLIWSELVKGQPLANAEEGRATAIHDPTATS